jgi:hypothetical protein
MLSQHSYALLRQVNDIISTWMQFAAYVILFGFHNVPIDRGKMVTISLLQHKSALGDLSTYPYSITEFPFLELHLLQVGNVGHPFVQMKTPGNFQWVCGQIKTPHS